MKIKELPEDFVVDEVFDVEKLKLKDEGKGDIYYYFVLKKKDYSQMRAMEIIANVFNTSRKLVHFAGNKDKVGITTQLISVRGINESNFEKNMEFFNSRFEDLSLEFLGKFKSRVNLGDNLGNRFKIVVRDLSEDVVLRARERLLEISENGVLNLFDEQRFGYANNSHIVGRYVLKNDMERAVYEIMTSLPPLPSDDLNVFVKFVEKNWEKIKEQDLVVIDEAVSLAPKFLRNEVVILNYLGRYKNDFMGAFRKIHKKLRTIYVNAYQSYIFNEVLFELKRRGRLDDYDEILLVSFDSVLEGEVKEIAYDLMKKDGVSLENFNLPSMPELKAQSVMRDVKIEVKDLVIEDEADDELYEGRVKVVVCFELKKGAYATNVVKQLFY